MYLVAGISYGNDLYHFGIPGMKWGVRHDNVPVATKHSGGYRGPYKNRRRSSSSYGSSLSNRQSKQERIRRRKRRAKTALKIGGAIAVAGLAVYGAKKLNDVVNKYNGQYLDSIRKTESDRINKAAIKAIKKNQRKWLFGGQTTKSRDARKSAILDASNNAFKMLDQGINNQRKSNFFNRAYNASKYFKQSRKK